MCACSSSAAAKREPLPCLRQVLPPAHACKPSKCTHAGSAWSVRGGGRSEETGVFLPGSSSIGVCLPRIGFSSVQRIAERRGSLPTPPGHKERVPFPRFLPRSCQGPEVACLPTTSSLQFSLTRAWERLWEKAGKTGLLVILLRLGSAGSSVTETTGVMVRPSSGISGFKVCLSDHRFIFPAFCQKATLVWFA